MNRLRRTLAIARKETLVLVRDRMGMSIMLGTPMIILAIFGYALSGEVKNLPIAVWDQDHTAESRALIDAYQVSGYFVAREYVDSYEEVKRSLDWGEVSGALVIPAGYAVAMERLEPIGVQFLLDGSDPATSGAIMSYATVIAQQHAANILLTRVPLQGNIPSLDFR
ncbi:MAG: ABC transporter permease, partial [Chloroflexi bacterium]|nr:ABC transporter permease [Chloroflexota bacterium]